MAGGGVQQQHIQQALTNFCVTAPVPGYVCDQIFPIVPVQKQSDKYYLIDPAREVQRTADDRRADNAEAAEVDWANDSDLFACQEHSLSSRVPDAVRDNADNVLRPMMNATRIVKSKLLLNKEIEARAKLDEAITNTADVAAAWTNPVSDPVADVTAKIDQITALIGVKPNIAVCDMLVFRALQNNPAVVDKVKYVVKATQEEMANTVAAMLGIERIIVSYARRNVGKAKNKNLTGTGSVIWGDGFYIGYVDPNPGIDTMGLSATFQWQGGGIQGYAIEQWWEQNKKSTVVRGTRWYDQKIVVPDAGAVLTKCLTKGVVA